MSFEQSTRHHGRNRALPASERSGKGDGGDAIVPVTRSRNDVGEADFLQDFFDNTPCGYALLGMDGGLVRANSAFLGLCGITTTAEQFGFRDLLSPSGAIFYETQFIPALLLRGSLKEVAFDLVQRSAERVPVLVNATVCRDGEGMPSGIRMALFEAKERRQYERDLLRSCKNSEQMAEVVRRSSDAIMKLSPEGKVESWNDGAEQIFGYTQVEAVGRSFVDLIFPGERGIDISQAVTILGQGNDVRKEVAGLHKDGREIALSISFTPHMEAPGTLVAFSAIMRDVSSRKLTERALIQSEKLASVGRLASSIAHEINNPLEAVTNLLYILDTQVSAPADKELVRMAQEELTRVSQIVTHTLRFHRQSSSRVDLDVGSLFVSILALYRARLSNSGIETVVNVSGAGLLHCYDGELRQILTNLIGNSFDAMRGGGRLILRHRETTIWSSGVKGVRITIADTGCGMDRETMKRIFEPFFTTKGIGGTGLGLWISRELVHKNFGVIRVRSSNRPGKSGTVAMLLFPYRPPVA